MAKDYIKLVLGMLPYGGYVLTSRHGEDVNAMVVNWVTQTSFRPRLLTVAVQKTCYSHALITDGQQFALNLFGKADGAESLRSVMNSRARDPEKMIKLAYTSAPETGCPLLEMATAYIECKVVQVIDVGGDHDLVVGAPVKAGWLKKPRKPGAKDTFTLIDFGVSYAG